MLGVALDLIHMVRWSTFLLSDGSGLCENAIMFGVDNCPSVHVDNRKKGISVLMKGPTDRLDDTSIKAEAGYSINFSIQLKLFFKFCITMEVTVFCLLMK